MLNKEAVCKEIVDRVFPPLNLEWEDHWQEIQKSELNRKNLGLLLQLGFETQQAEVRAQLIQDFHKALFPNNGTSTTTPHT
ncbi:MAG: hypothetical protein Q8R30_04540 [bacterium]|nr:hypothetical protein [bacterium]MDZ4285457.1 hypothetical protein [Candidatus Sungbacteria bacterium]